MDLQHIELHGLSSDIFRLITGVAQGKNGLPMSLAAHMYGFATWYQMRQLLRTPGYHPLQRRRFSTP